jgi:pimeloyl-ACP methyl ester carboxylesterase
MKNLNTPGSIAELQVNDGVTLRYLKAGAGAPLVLLHTIRTQLDYFRAVIPRLAEHYTVYAVDLPGHGHSSIDKTAAYDEPYFREAMIAFIERLDLHDVTLVGESIGGVLAMTVAGALPDRVKAVVASNPYDYDSRYGDGVRRGNLIANAIIGSFGVPVIGAVSAGLENRLFLGMVLKGGLHNPRNLPDDLLAEFDRVGRRSGYRHVERKTFAGWRSWGEARRLYQNIKVPVTLIYGDEDWSRAGERQRNGSEVPGATMTTIPETGHFAFLEHPNAIVDIILRRKVR